MQPAAPVRIGVLAALVVLGAAASADPDLRELALQWSQGEFGSPLICEVGGVAKRGLRRVVVEPAKGQRPPANRLRFFDVDLPPDSRCHDDMGAEQLNAVGAVMFTLDGHSRPDIATRDFGEAIERNHGFDFQIRSGVLQIGEPGAALDALRRVDFRGGTVEVRNVVRGSDADRRLGDFRGGRRLLLALRARDGTRLDLDLVMIGGP